MSHPKTQDPHISWPGNVHQIGMKGTELSDHPVPIPAEQGIAIQIMVQPERRQTSLQLERGEGLLTGNPRLGATVNAKERKLLPPCKCGELPAQRGNAVGFMERIGEEGDAQRLRQYEFLASERIRKSPSTADASLRLGPFI